MQFSTFTFKIRIMKMILNIIGLFHETKCACMEQFKHGRLVRKKKILEHMCTVLCDIASESDFSITGSLLDSPKNTSLETLSEASNFIIYIDLSSSSRLRMHSAFRALAYTTKHCELLVPLLPKWLRGKSVLTNSPIRAL